MASEVTRQRLLDAAERLFADHGYGLVSLRRIIAAAQVNLAAVHYHFGSKTALFEAVLRRRIAPLNAERLRLLDALQANFGHRPPPLPRLLEALLGPALRLSQDPERGGDQFMRLMGRTLADPSEAMQKLLFSQFQEVAERFFPVMRQAVPGVPKREFFFRLQFTLGAMAHTMAHARYFQLVSGGLCDPSDVDALIERLVAYSSAGMGAAVAARSGSPRKSSRSSARTGTTSKVARKAARRGRGGVAGGRS